MLLTVNRASGSEHIEQESFRHWSAESQEYAPSDVLFNYLRTGWLLEKTIIIETFYYSGYRRVDVVYFTLRRGEESFEMPVLSNPSVNRLIEECGLSIVQTNNKQATV